MKGDGQFPYQALVLSNTLLHTTNIPQEEKPATRQSHSRVY